MSQKKSHTTDFPKKDPHRRIQDASGLHRKHPSSETVSLFIRRSCGTPLHPDSKSSTQVWEGQQLCICTLFILSNLSFCSHHLEGTWYTAGIQYMLVHLFKDYRHHFKCLLKRATVLGYCSCLNLTLVTLATRG